MEREKEREEKKESERERRRQVVEAWSGGQGQASLHPAGSPYIYPTPLSHSFLALTLRLTIFLALSHFLHQPSPSHTLLAAWVDLFHIPSSETNTKSFHLERGPTFHASGKLRAQLRNKYNCVSYDIKQNSTRT